VEEGGVDFNGINSKCQCEGYVEKLFNWEREAEGCNSIIEHKNYTGKKIGELPLLAKKWKEGGEGK